MHTQTLIYIYIYIYIGLSEYVESTGQVFCYKLFCNKNVHLFHRQKESFVKKNYFNKSNVHLLN